MSKVVKKITRPVSKVLDKVIPNEIKPILPYLAAAAPFLAPATFAAGASGIGSLSGLGSMASRAALSGALNLGAQLSQEGSEGEFNPFTLALAAGSGALTDPTAGAAIRGKTFASQMGDTGATRNLFQKGVDFGLEGLAKTADVMSAGATPGATLGAKLTAASAPIGIEATKSAYDAALAAQKAYEQQLSDYYKQTGELLEDNSSARISAITSSMLNAGFGQTDIDDALRQIGLLSVGGRVGFNSGGDTNTPIKKIIEEYDEYLKFLKEQKEKETEKKAEGGIISLRDGYKFGALVKAAQKGKQVVNYLRRMFDNTELNMNLIDSDVDGVATPTGYDVYLNPKSKKAKQVIEGLMDEGYSIKKSGDEYVLDMSGLDEGALEAGKSKGLRIGGEDIDRLKKEGVDPMYSSMEEKEIYDQLIRPKRAEGGIMNLSMGGTPMEMDYRGGGFIPIGAKEKADDVPARLSKNEFVMTADAVRGMGGGDVNRGAERMYDIMNRYEAIGRA